MLQYNKVLCCMLAFCISLSFAAQKTNKHSVAKIPTRSVSKTPTCAGLCLPRSAQCSCMQKSEFVQFATARHGAPVRAVSWCCQSVTNRAGHPSIHLAIAGDPVVGTLPGETIASTILIRIYQLDLVTQQFTEMNSFNINARVQAAGETASEIHSINWCCSDDASFLIAGGNNLAYYPDLNGVSNIADVVVFAFDNASWQKPTTARIPFALGKTGYYYYTYGNTVYAVSALLSSFKDSTTEFYLAVAGETSTLGSRKQISIVTFVLSA